MGAVVCRIHSILPCASDAPVGQMSAQRNAASNQAASQPPAPDAGGKWVYIDKSSKSFFELYKELDAWQRELVARKWLKSEGYFWGAEHRLRNNFYMHLAACCRQPAGRADGLRGSQQCCFELEVMHEMALGVLGIDFRSFQVHKNARYTIGRNNEIVWAPSSSIDSYFMDDMVKMSEWIAFETRDATKHLYVHGSTKSVVRRSEGVKVTATLIPPFIIEMCRRSHDRMVLAVSCNLFTFNDRGGLDLPPEFPYAEGERGKFRQLAINNLMGMSNSGMTLSKMMARLLPPAYRHDEEEGEETSFDMDMDEEEDCA